MRGAVLACAYLSCYGPIEGPKFIKGDMSSKKKNERKGKPKYYFIFCMAYRRSILAGPVAKSGLDITWRKPTVDPSVIYWVVKKFNKCWRSLFGPNVRPSNYLSYVSAFLVP
jgi:hypothetical protein